MLSLTVISANQGETYYTAENYYSSEENQAHSVGLAKEPRAGTLGPGAGGCDFKNLLHGSHPQGTANPIQSKG
jgi:hypothetical protein